MQETPPLSDVSSLGVQSSSEPEYRWGAADASPLPVGIKGAGTFYFANERWRVVVLWVVQGIASIVIAAYLLTQIPIAPKIMNQLLLCAGFMVGLGLFGLFRAARDLMSRVRVTEGGIVVQEFVHYRFVPWSELDGWIVRTPNDGDDSLPSVEIAIKGNAPKIEISRGSLSFGDLVALKAILTNRAAGLSFS